MTIMGKFRERNCGASDSMSKKAAVHETEALHVIYARYKFELACCGED